MSHLSLTDKAVAKLFHRLHLLMEFLERHFTWRNVTGLCAMVMVGLFVWVGGPLAGSAMLLALSYGYRLWTRRITITVDHDHGEVVPEKPLQE